MARAAQDDPDNRKSIQAVAYDAINSLTYDHETIYLLLFQRTLSWGMAGTHIISRSDVTAAFQAASDSPRPDAYAWIKTASNGWCTSYRMHEPRKLPCIFGCRGCTDELKHYLSCHVLWSLIDEFFTGCVDPSAAGRINYVRPSPKKTMIISATFEVYHTLKIGLREVVNEAVSQSRFCKVIDIARKLIIEKRATLVTAFGAVSVLRPIVVSFEGEPRPASQDFLLQEASDVLDQFSNNEAVLPANGDILASEQQPSQQVSLGVDESDELNLAQGSWPSAGFQARCG